VEGENRFGARARNRVTAMHPNDPCTPRACECSPRK